LPDGTDGVVSSHFEEWYVYWEHSNKYCGALALGTYLPQLSKEEAQAETVQIAESLTEETAG
jgi:hypothetical protein